MRHLPPVAAVIAGLLAACQPRAAEDSAAPQPAAPTVTMAAPTTDFSQDMVALGTEPFWSLTMRGTAFELLRPGRPAVKLKAPGAEIRPGEGIWRATAEDGGAMTVILRAGECSDGMSDRTYPMSAEVEFAGDTLHGCAARASDIGSALQGALGAVLG